jgi:hypothetical protein
MRVDLSVVVGLPSSERFMAGIDLANIYDYKNATAFPPRVSHGGGAAGLGCRFSQWDLLASSPSDKEPGTAVANSPLY